MKRTIRPMLALLALSLSLAAGPAAQETGSAQALLRAAADKATVDGDLPAAIQQYQTIVERFKTDRPVVATAFLAMAECYRKLGAPEARTIYERLTHDFSDQKEAADAARARLAALPPTAGETGKQAVRQIAARNELGGEATPSSDGRYLTFTDSTGNVAIRDLRSGSTRRLTTTGDWSASYSNTPVMSPDGRLVAYNWYLHHENAAEVRLISTAPSEAARPQVILRMNLNAAVYKIAWAPDGSQLQVVRASGDRTSQIGTVSIREKSFRNLKSLDWRTPNLFSLSPDGRYLAYDIPAGEAGSPHDILVLSTDGSRETVVVQNPANDSFPLWSPDGTHLVFLSDRNGRNSVWMVPMNDGRATGPAVPIKNDVGPIRLIGLTNAGTLFYFEPNLTYSNLYVSDLDATRVTKPSVPISERLINANVGSAWSHDGQYLAYYSFREISADSRNAVLVIRVAKSGDERTVALPARVSSRFWAGPKWFPDNRSVLVESGDAQGPGFGFYRLALDTSNIELLTHLPAEVSSYDLSQDGRTIFYALNVDPGQKLIRFDIEGHRDTELRSAAFSTASGLSWSEIVSLAVSPDGTQLATTMIGGRVEVMPAAGGESREVFRPAAAPEIGTGQLRQALTWTPDQRFLLWARGDGTLWKVPALGGPAESMGIPLTFVKSPTVHPDGKQLVFSAAAGPNTSKILALDNFLPAAYAKR